MKAMTLYNMKQHTKSAIDSLFSCARIMGMRADEITSAYIAILADRPNMPRYMREYMQGRFDLHWETLYRESLVFGGFCDGVFYSTHSNRADYYGKHGIEPGDWAQKVDSKVIQVGHYWTTTVEPKPF